MPPDKTALPMRAARAGTDPDPLQVTAQDVHLAYGTREYRVRGLERNHSGRQLRVTILAVRDELVHMDTLDLCQARARGAFIKATAEELFQDEAVIKQDIGRLLLELEQLRDQRIEAALAPSQPQVELSAAEQQAALELLKDPRLTERILQDYDTCGLVGEATNKLICYLACVSRKLPRPLAVLVHSSSAAGKTSLLDATLAFMPPEDQLRFSAMTGQSLYYLQRHALRHKILSVAEDGGAARAGYALKLLQSDGRLRMASTGTDQGSGRHETRQYEVEGPVMLMWTSTAEQPDAELADRCLRLQTSESPQQTAAIQARQREAFTPQGQARLARRAGLLALHRNAQRLLEPLAVVIPWADRLTFRHDRIRMRREHARYLGLIAASSLLHQYQRPRGGRHAGDQSPYVEATPEDLELANRLVGQVLGQSLSGLLPQTRRLLDQTHRYVTRRARAEQAMPGAIRFTQRQLREALEWGDFQLRRHLARLVQLEYVLPHRTGQGNQRCYELLWDGEGLEGISFLLGLADRQACGGTTDAGPPKA